jgi:hypothetical protein
VGRPVLGLTEFCGIYVLDDRRRHKGHRGKVESGMEVFLAGIDCAFETGNLVNKQRQ